MNPDVNLLMRLTKDQLLYKACRYRLISVKHSKRDLAEAIATYESEQRLRDYRAISNGRKEV